MALESRRERSGQPIYWIGGSKGGVGKSMVAMATMDLLLGRNERVLLVECDTSNPDVWKTYRNDVEKIELVDLDKADGWIHLVNVAGAEPEHIIVINTAARNNAAVEQFGTTLGASLEELGRPLVALWVINRQRDSVELLKDFARVLPEALVHVVRNGHFGDERRFDLYNESETRKALVEARGGRSVTFPDLADRVADDLYTKRLTIAAASKALPIGNRAELARWRGETRKALGEILDGA
jgi:hypothetical protein